MRNLGYRPRIYPLLWQIEPAEQLDQCRFSSTIFTDNGKLFAGTDGQIKILQQGFFHTFVFISDMLKRNFRRCSAGFLFVMMACMVGFILQVQILFIVLDGDHLPGQIVVFVNYADEPCAESADDGKQEDKICRRNAPVD